MLIQRRTEIRWMQVGDSVAAAAHPDEACRGLTLLVDGNIAANLWLRIGRSAFPTMVSAEVTDLGRANPIALHKFALHGLVLAQQYGTRSLLAYADKCIPSAERWLIRLGFVFLDEVDEGPVYRWDRQFSNPSGQS